MARSFGIQLAPGETWVKPHERGLASDVIGEFAWRLPAGLSEQFSVMAADHGI